MLKVSNLTKLFGGIHALENVSLEVPEGVTTGVIGPNGSGKTTLFNCITGIHSPDAGEVLFKGERINGLRPHEICRKGIGRTFQIVRPFVSMTALQSVQAALVFGRRLPFKRSASEAMDLLRLVGLEGKAGEPSSKLTLAERKKLEVARAVAAGPSLLLLDEVAAGLDAAESQSMISLVKKLESMGITILMIEHVMPMIMALCRNIIVLAEGRKVTEGPPERVAQDTRVQELYFGRRTVAPTVHGLPVAGQPNDG